MELFGKNLDRNVVIVAELGVNHEGDPAQAVKMIHLAADAGADAVKFQTYTPERFVSASDAARLERVRQFSLSQDDFRMLALVARERGVGFFSTPVTEDMVDFVAELGDAVKIASGDIVFEPMIRAAARTRKCMIVSTGNATVSEIDLSMKWCAEEKGDAFKDQVALLHCVAAYPTPIEQSNILSVPFLRNRYGLTTGYSSHVIGPEAVFAAVALGAQIVEVHFTDSRENRTFHDHLLSCDPDDLRALVASVGRIKACLGRYGKELVPAEEPLRPLMRKGVVAARALAAGTILKREDLMFARPATEIPAAEINSLVGRILRADRDAGEQIRRADFES